MSYPKISHKLARLSFACLIMLGIATSVGIQQSEAFLRLRSTPNVLAFSALQGRGDSVRNSLFVMQADGSQRRRLVPNLTDIFSPIVWSRDGKKLAFVNNSSHIYTVQANGYRLIPLFKGEFCKAETYQIVWSANNQRIVFGRSCDGSTSDEPGRVELYWSTATSIHGTRKVESLPPDSFLISLAPNGQKVAFIKDNDIYSMNFDGSQVTNLTQKPASYSSGGSTLFWSPDSRKIAFWVGEYPQQQLYVMNADGSNLKNLTNSPNHQIYNVDLAWSPDSEKIAYTRQQPGEYSAESQEIYRVDVNSGRTTKLTQKLDEYSHLTWSPNGNQLAFVVGEFSNQSIHTLNLTNLQTRNLTSRLPLTGVTELAWSPDSQQLAFNFSEGENSALYVVNQDGIRLKRLSQRTETISFPVWQP